MDKIEQIVDQYFRNATDTDQQLELLSVNGMAEAVDWAVNKSSTNAISSVVK